MKLKNLVVLLVSLQALSVSAAPLGDQSSGVDRPSQSPATQNKSPVDTSQQEPGNTENEVDKLKKDNKKAGTKNGVNSKDLRTGIKNPIDTKPGAEYNPEGITNKPGGMGQQMVPHQNQGPGPGSKDYNDLGLDRGGNPYNKNEPGVGSKPGGIADSKGLPGQVGNPNSGTQVTPGYTGGANPKESKPGAAGQPGSLGTQTLPGQAANPNSQNQFEKGDIGKVPGGGSTYTGPMGSASGDPSAPVGEGVPIDAPGSGAPSGGSGDDGDSGGSPNGGWTDLGQSLGGANEDKGKNKDDADGTDDTDDGSDEQKDSGEKDDEQDTDGNNEGDGDTESDDQNSESDTEDNCTTDCDGEKTDTGTSSNPNPLDDGGCVGPMCSGMKQDMGSSVSNPGSDKTYEDAGGGFGGDVMRVEDGNGGIGGDRMRLEDGDGGIGGPKMKSKDLKKSTTTK